MNELPFLFSKLYFRYTLDSKFKIASSATTNSLWHKCFMHTVEEVMNKKTLQDSVLFFIFIITECNLFDNNKKELLKSAQFKAFKQEYSVIPSLNKNNVNISNSKQYDTLLKDWYFKKITNMSFYVSTRCLFKDRIHELEKSKNYNMLWQKIQFICSNYYYTDEEKEFLKEWCKKEKKERGIE